MAELSPVDFLSGLGTLPDPLRDLHEQTMRALVQNRGQLENQQLGIENAGKQQDQAEQQQYIADLRQHFGTNPTAAGMAYMAARYPKAAQGIKAAAQIVDQNRQQTDLTQLGSIWSVGQSALSETDPAKQDTLWQRAADLARGRLRADQEAGVSDEDDARFVQMLESPNPDDRSLALGLIRGDHARGGSRLGAELLSGTRARRGCECGDPSGRSRRRSDLLQRARLA
jgi:hypothetical protein